MYTLVRERIAKWSMEARGYHSSPPTPGPGLYDTSGSDDYRLSWLKIKQIQWSRRASRECAQRWSQACKIPFNLFSRDNFQLAYTPQTNSEQPLPPPPPSHLSARLAVESLHHPRTVKEQRCYAYSKRQDDEILKENTDRRSALACTHDPQPSPAAPRQIWRRLPAGVDHSKRQRLESGADP